MWGRVVAEAKTFLGISRVFLKVPLFFKKGETKAGKALKSCFFWKRGWGEKVTWELIPYQSLRKKGQIWGA